MHAFLFSGTPFVYAPASMPLQAASAGLLMRHTPSPGLLGLLRDALRLLQGIRLLSNSLITLVFPLPLPLAAATHLSVVLLTRNNEQYCQTQVGCEWHLGVVCCADCTNGCKQAKWTEDILHTCYSVPLSQPTTSMPPTLLHMLQLLRHPLMLHRFRVISAWMDDSLRWLATPATAMLNLKPGWTSTGADPLRQDCLALMVFLQMVFSVLPVVLLAWRQARRPRPQAATQTPARLEQREQGGQRRLDHVRQWTHAVWRSSDAALQRGCMCRCSWGFCLCCITVLLPAIWLLAKMAV